jgi:hypothetical protein
MSPPIRDGSGNSIGAIRLGDGSEISEVRTGAGDVLFSAIPDSGISRWEYEDDTDTSTANDSWNGYPGTITGASFVSDSALGSLAIDCDGIDDLIDFSDISEVDNAGQMSATTRIKPDNTSSFQYVFGKDEPASRSSGWSLNISDTGAIRADMHDGSNFNRVTGSTLTTNTYYMLTQVIDLNNSEMRLYLDGSPDGSTSISNAPASTTTPVKIADNLGGFGYFDGTVDDSRLYSKALSDTEVSNLFNNGSI